jgi:hypothetical protein
MKAKAIETNPVRGSAHDALDVFLGEWRAVGMSFGGTDQTGPDPKANGERWESTHTTHWHTGKFFMIQDERALIAGKTFDTLSILGLEAGSQSYFARTFENHGFYRRYRLSVNGQTWLLTGETERARTIFDASGNTQTITWEWLRNGKWLPLCDRVATRVDRPASRRK